MAHGFVADSVDTKSALLKAIYAICSPMTGRMSIWPTPPGGRAHEVCRPDRMRSRSTIRPTSTIRTVMA
jgi:hypothetical protein